MDERQALLLAAIANPEEDTPRLVLADWLEEHGDEHDNPAFARLRKLTLYHINARTRPLSIAVEQRLRDRFGDELSLEYSVLCLRS